MGFTLKPSKCPTAIDFNIGENIVKTVDQDPTFPWFADNIQW